MKKSVKYRSLISDARRIVVKIGSRVLVQKTGRPDVRRMRNIINEIAQLQKQGCQMIVITSGAVAAGMEALKMKERPACVPDLQMAAAIGQTRLMSRYAELFGKKGYLVGQMLLTHADFNQKIRLTNAKRTLENLLRNGVIPVVNENDVVADEEIRADLSLGDNDSLASMVVRMIRADLLIMLTTVDGVLSRSESGRMQRIKYMESITQSTFKLVSDEKNPLSKGGMATKLKAAKIAVDAGCSAVIANGRHAGVLTRIMKSEDVGTMIVA